jgi:Tol biopolymer transport system component/DNA-binding winged helix-turn-helix (wHTH) protein
MGMPVDTPRTWRFGVFELDASSGELRRNGTVVKLREQPARILVLLLEHAGQMVTREQLRQHLWPSDTFVDFDHSLNSAVMKLREALGDSADKPLYIETIPRKGYRFVAPVSQPGDTQNGGASPRLPAISEMAVSNTWEQSHGSVEVRTITPDEKRKPKRLLFVLVPVALVLLAVGFLAMRLVKNRDAPVRSAQPAAKSAESGGMRIVPLTSLPGAVGHPAISADGEKIAFTWKGENPVRSELYVQLVGAEKPLQLTHTNTGFVCCADWSPDGREIAFGRCDDNGGGVFVVPALGGPERKLTDVVCPFGVAGFPKWTADGKSLVLEDRCMPEVPKGIVLLSLATGEKRCLHTPPAGDVGDMDPVLSPDQKTVAFLRFPTIEVADIYTVSLSGGVPRQLTREGVKIWELMWSTDGSRIAFMSNRSGLPRVWQIPATGGDIKPETVYPATGTLSRDGKRLVYVDPPGGRSSSTTIWRAELSSAGGRAVSQNRIVATGSENTGMQLSPDGSQIAFESTRSGSSEIWRSNVDGSNALQLTFMRDKGKAGTPRWSPDGKWIVFDHRPKGHSQIYAIDEEGRNLHAITGGDYDNVVPSWSRDGAFIYFSSNRTGGWQVWRREVSTGREQQITRQGGFAAFESYDAKSVYYSRFEDGGLWRATVEGGKEEHIANIPHVGYWGHFAVSENGLYVLDSDSKPGPTIMYYDFQTHRLNPVLTLKQDPVAQTANLAASRDGRTLLFAQGEAKSSITMVENFQ